MYKQQNQSALSPCFALFSLGKVEMSDNTTTQQNDNTTGTYTISRDNESVVKATRHLKS